MKYFLFHKPTGGQPDFIKGFRTKRALEKFAEKDLDNLKKAYPKEKWRMKDYMIAERIRL